METKAEIEENTQISKFKFEFQRFSQKNAKEQKPLIQKFKFRLGSALGERDFFFSENPRKSFFWSSESDRAAAERPEGPARPVLP